MPLINFNPPVIAHRGASGYAPENTVSAFVKAAQLGIKWIEFDVIQAACGLPIVFHDEELDRLTLEKGRVADYPYVMLSSLDVGRWYHSRFSGERIPAFSQVLDLIANYQLSANIELKPEEGKEDRLVRSVLKNMSTFFSLPDMTYLFSSFSIEALYSLRRLAPQVMIGLLLHEWRSDWERICNELDAISVHVNHEILTSDRADEIKKTGRNLLSYTVNDPKLARKLFGWGVDAVFSDYPDKIISA
jgi:glycerophosphoryl diester phosphodiesterase